MSPTEPNLDEELAARLGLDAHAGPAARISRERARDLVSAALAGWPESAAQRASPRRTLTRTQVAAAVALLFAAFASGASAALWMWGKREQKPSLSQPAAKVVAVSKPKTLATSPVPVLQEELTPPQPPTIKARRSDAASEDLLQRANRLRAGGAFVQARDAYAEVARRFPKSLSAYAAQVASAALELEHLRDPAAARVLYERALKARPQGALSLEAWRGLANSLRALDLPQAEAHALKEVLRLAPDGPTAQRARARLLELERAR